MVPITAQPEHNLLLTIAEFIQREQSLGLYGPSILTVLFNKDLWHTILRPLVVSNKIDKFAHNFFIELCPLDLLFIPVFYL